MADEISAKLVGRARLAPHGIAIAAVLPLFLGLCGMAQAQVAQQYWQCRQPSTGVEAGWCPTSTTNPIPVTPSAPSGTQDVNITQTGGVTQLRGAGAVGTGSERVAVGQDTSTIAGSAPGTAGTASANVVTVQGVASMTPLLASISPGSRTIVPLDVATVTTGGTAVTALTAGHRSAGGFLYNPIGASINLCINEQGTASGTTSAGALTCIQPGQGYQLAPTSTAVSVITSDSSHPFSGYGLN